MYPEIVIAGCGNPLFADDGFSPAVVEELKKITLPESVKAVDAGLGGPEFVFTMLDPAVTKKLIVVDIVDSGAESGAITTLQVNGLPPESIRNAHPGGISESLQQIKDRIEITIVGCQPKYVPVPRMDIGLSDEVQKAVPGTVREILEIIGMNSR